MKKLLLLSALFIFACSGGDNDSENNGNNENNENNNSNNSPDDPIIGNWVLGNEEWVADGSWPEGTARGCFMEGDEGSPDTLVFSESMFSKTVWECFLDGSLAEEETVYDPENWSNLGDDIYDLSGEIIEVTFVGNNEMQMPFGGDGEIIQTWIRTE